MAVDLARGGGLGWDGESHVDVDRGVGEIGAGGEGGSGVGDDAFGLEAGRGGGGSCALIGRPAVEVWVGR